MELTKSQKLVINTKNKSLLVSASAGSGKTFVVVERIVESIKSGKDISSMLILTFTNAAASELKERIVSKLYDIKEEYLKAGDKENAKRIAKQISAAPASDVSTIHSFCLSTIRNNFYSLGIDPNVQTIEETKATLMLYDAIEEVLEEEYATASDIFTDILDMLGNEETLIEMLFKLHKACCNTANKQAWLNKITEVYSVNGDEIKDLTEISFGKEVLKSIKNTLEIEAMSLTRVIDKLDSVSDFETRKEVLENILSIVNRARSKETFDEIYLMRDELINLPQLPRKAVPDEELKKEVSAVRNSVSKKLKSIVTKLIYKDTKGIIEELNSSLCYAEWYKDIIHRVDEKYTLAKREKALIDFSDYEHLTLKALEDENTRKKYIEKYDEIYIDEYQDTSDIQETILMSIAKENNVIMVGDVKQSIYGFRNAAPELFSAKYARLEEIENMGDKEGLKEAKILLAQNFRSRKEVIDSTNEVFGKLMSETFGGASYGKKEELVLGAAYPLDEGYKAELHIVEKDTEEEVYEHSESDEGETEAEDVITDLSSLELEAGAIVNRIRELMTNNFQVYDLKKKEYRKCEYKDIVILMSKVDKTASIVQNVLTKAGIPTYTDAKTGFYKSDEISLIISFLKILNNIEDDIPLASVLYSIIGRFTLDELVKIRKGNTKYSLYESLNKYLEQDNKEQEIIDKINNFLNVIDRFKRYVKTYSLATVILKLYDETGIYEAMRFEKSGEMKCANLDAFVNIVADYEKSENVTSLYLTLKYLNTLKKKESAGDSPKLLGENENVVRIMTMHKSKGLEFPVVFIANTTSPYNETELSDKILTSNTLGIGLDIYDKSTGITYPSIIKQVIKQNTRNRLRSEALRLLYVAFTRAKEKLIITGIVNKTLDHYAEKMLFVDGKVPDSVAFEHACHLKCILQAVYEKPKHIDIKRYNVSMIMPKDTDEIIDRKNTKIEAFKEKVKELGIKENRSKVDEIKSKLNTNYPYELDVEQKYTATKLSHKENEVSKLSELKPLVLEEVVTGASYGTFMHSVIENLDLNNVTKESIKEVIDTRVKAMGIEGRINIPKAIAQIEKLYNTFLKDIVKDAKKIENEFEFVFEDDLKDIDGLEPLKAPSLIQGIIDMYVETKDDRRVIIDFKTDSVENEQELIDRYRIQLNVYRRAINVCYNKEVDEVYIYSFALNKMIKVN
ncbi:MAG: UvrD-helicase domain-containing protein [Clostridia bacterium]|nr:UvrD-helicase domain-containing protein [Clostridia bacterium]